MESSSNKWNTADVLRDLHCLTLQTFSFFIYICWSNCVYPTKQSYKSFLPFPVYLLDTNTRNVNIVEVFTCDEKMFVTLRRARYIVGISQYDERTTAISICLSNSISFCLL